MEHPLGDGRVGHRMTHKLGWPTCRQPVAGGVGEQPKAERAEGSPMTTEATSPRKIWPIDTGESPMSPSAVRGPLPLECSGAGPIWHRSVGLA